MAPGSTSIETIRLRRTNYVSVTMGRACVKVLMTILLAMLVMLVGVSPSAAQLETGSVVGIVTDSSGAVYAGAQVVIENKLTGAKIVLTTSGAGVYDAPVLPLGDYR